MYRRHRYYTSNNPEWLDWTGLICTFGLLIALIAGVIAAESASCATLSDKSHTICLERPN
jgi:hypothetical protein